MRFQSTFGLPPEDSAETFMKLKRKSAPRGRPSAPKPLEERARLDLVLAAGKSWQACLGEPKALRRKICEAIRGVLQTAAAGVLRYEGEGHEGDGYALDAVSPAGPES